MHEHVARVMYYFSVHLLYASMVASAAWVLTSIPRASATTKYWIWVVTAFNFILPLGAVVDRLWALHLSWAAPLGAIGGPVWDMTQGQSAVALAGIWGAGAFAMLVRLIAHLRRDRRQAQGSTDLSHRTPTATFVADGIPVRFGHPDAVPAVSGVLYPRICLPVGIDQLLSERELNAVLLHELAHARRRDNLIRLIYEAALCALWFHPLIWLVGARMTLYRELSCDESVVQREHGTELVSALAKLAVPGPDLFLQASALSHLRHRLARLAEAPRPAGTSANLVVASLFAAVLAAGGFETVAHTACCFVLRH